MQDDVLNGSVQTEASDASKSCSAVTLQKDAMGTLVNVKDRLPRAVAALACENRSISVTSTVEAGMPSPVTLSNAESCSASSMNLRSSSGDAGLVVTASNTLGSRPGACGSWKFKERKAEAKDVPGL